MTDTTVTTVTDSNTSTKNNDETARLIRQSLLSTMESKYVEFKRSLFALPFPIQFFTMAVHELDSGWLWIKEIISSAELQFNTPEPTPPEPTQEAQTAAEVVATSDESESSETAPVVTATVETAQDAA